MRIIELHDHLILRPCKTALVTFDAGAAPAASDTAAWLSAAECQYWSRLPSSRRRAVWFAGRVAAKTAIRQVIADSLPLTRVEVLPASSGAPLVRLETSVSDSIAVSISHSGRLAVAIAFHRADVGAMGIDIEAEDQSLDLALLDLAFLAEEKDALVGAADAATTRYRVLQFWTAKEAVLKALGCGLRLPLASVRLACSSDGPSRAVVAGPGGDIAFDVQSTELFGHVLSLAGESDRAG